MLMLVSCKIDNFLGQWVLSVVWLDLVVKINPAEEHVPGKRLQRCIGRFKWMINRIDKDEGFNFNSDILFFCHSSEHL